MNHKENRMKVYCENPLKANKKSSLHSPSASAVDLKQRKRKVKTPTHDYSHSFGWNR